jgi:hypothetical protein
MLVDWPNSTIIGAALTKSNPFKWRRYESEIILLCVRWYLRYSLSYRDLEEMMRERRPLSRSHDDLSVGSGVRSGTGEKNSSSLETDQ